MIFAIPSGPPDEDGTPHPLASCEVANGARIVADYPFCPSKLLRRGALYVFLETINQVSVLIGADGL